MIRHIVLFKFKPEITEDERRRFLEMLNGLPAKIPVIRGFEAGQDVIRSPRSFDMALVSSYDDLAALDVYAKHPDHLPIVERAREICQQVVAVDFEF